MRANPNAQAYREELGPFLRWYFQQVADHQARHGGNREFDDYLVELEQRGGALRSEVLQLVEQVEERLDPLDGSAGDTGVVGRAFDVPASEGPINLPGVMSRKKQVAPKLLAAVAE